MCRHMHTHACTHSHTLAHIHTHPSKNPYIPTQTEDKHTKTWRDTKLRYGGRHREIGRKRRERERERERQRERERERERKRYREREKGGKERMRERERVESFVHLRQKKVSP